MMLQIAGDCKGELGMALDNNKKQQYQQQHAVKIQIKSGGNSSLISEQHGEV